MTPGIIAQNVKFIAAELGFQDCRIATPQPAPHAAHYRQWIADGKHGDMGWLARNLERRTDPRQVLPDCRAIVCLAFNYFPGKENPASDYQISRYAWNEDYHHIVEEKLKDLDLALQTFGGTQRYYVDTGPILERDFANESGLGWNGKSTVQIHKKLGTWFFLAEILTTLPLPSDGKKSSHCGTCTACIDICPTRAITAPHRLDARRCISYLTIEHKGSIPLELRPLIGNRIYGCDDCLVACPWNRFAQRSHDLRLQARPEIFAHRLRDFLSLDDGKFRTLFARSPIKRIKRPRFLRNVCVALGNTDCKDDLPALEIAAHDPHPLISEHAQWAIQKRQLNKKEES